MRIILGVLCFLIMAFGVLIGVVYPFAASHQESYELARWEALDGRGGFREFETLLPRSEEQVLVKVELETNTPETFGDAVVIVVKAVAAERSQFTRALGLRDIEPLPAQGDNPGNRFLLDVETVQFIRDEPYRFMFEEGVVGMPFSSVELILVGGTYEFDASVPPIGFGMIAIGMTGMFLTDRKSVV